jgi:hypothetical protein
MKKHLLLATLLVTGMTGNCQVNVFDLPLDRADAGDLKAHPLYDPLTGNIILSLFSYNKLQRYFFAGADTFSRDPVRLTGIRVYDKYTRDGSILSYDHYLGSHLTAHGIEECVTDRKFSVIRWFHTDFRDSSLKETDSIPIPAGERLFAWYYQQGDFYALGLPKTADLIHVYRRRAGRPVEVLQKELPVKGWGSIRRDGGKKRIDDLGDLVNGIGMIREDTATPSLLATLAEVKLYTGRESIYFTCDNSRLQTRVIEVPLDDRPCRLLEFDAAAYYHKEIPPGFSNGNSYIFDSTLVVASIIHRQLYVAFYDLSSGKLLVAYTPDEKGNNTFPHSAAYQVGDFWKKGVVHRISMDEFYKNSFDFWTLGVNARRLGNDQVELEIGTIYNRETFGKFMLALGTMGLGAMGGSPSVIFLGPNASPKNTMFFKSRFHTGTFTALPFTGPDTGGEDKSELIGTFVDSLKVSWKDISMVQYNDSYWLGFIDPEQHHYVVYKF